MSDLRSLLEDATPPPSGPPDVDALWLAGRHRRRQQRTAAGTGLVAALMVVAVIAVNAIDRPSSLDIGPVGPGPETSPTTTPSPRGTPTQNALAEDTWEPRQAPEVLRRVGSIVDGPVNTTTVAGLTLQNGTVQLRRLNEGRGADLFEIVTDHPASTLHALAVTGAGDVGFQVADGRNTRVLLLPAGADEPVEVLRSDQEFRASVAGSAELDGRSALLVAEGRAVSLIEDEGMDIVAYFPDGTRRVLVEDATPAWEGGVASADARGGWIVWQESGTTGYSIWAARVDEPTERTELLRSEPEAGDAEPVGMVIVELDAGEPVLGVLLHHRAAFPDEPSAELLTLELARADVRATYEVGPVSWQEGFPTGLDRLGQEWLVSRMGEGFAVRPALVGVPPEWRSTDLLGLVRAAG